MNKYFAYTRVSTARQGEFGVSLEQQRSAIERYAENRGLEIVHWFEERETAAKRGRPVFNSMLSLLKQEKAAGVVIHKIDRSARNLRDWADLGGLIDEGIRVHFANEGIDLESRGGRLSADIQAVVAADFIRNLREETKKGIYGRLKQGLYPMPAPMGYLDVAPGKPKAVDPVTAPHIRDAFELYASKRYSLRGLASELAARNLRSRFGKFVSVNQLSRILRNSFYTGCITVKKTGESYAGIHEPIVSVALFDRVQQRLKEGGKPHEPNMRGFLFSQSVRCKLCGYMIVGERHKGHVYYCCKTPACATKSTREELLDAHVRTILQRLTIPENEYRCYQKDLDAMKGDWKTLRRKMARSFQVNLGASNDRMSRLTDAYLEGLLDKETFQERKQTLVAEREVLLGGLRTVDHEGISALDSVEAALEFARDASAAYEEACIADRRELIFALTSNRLIAGKTLDFTLQKPFQAIANRVGVSDGCPRTSVVRTSSTLIEDLLAMASELPTLRSVTRKSEDKFKDHYKRFGLPKSRRSDNGNHTIAKPIET